MNYASRLGIAVCFVCGTLLLAQNTPPPSDSRSSPEANPNEIDITPPQPRTTFGAIDILTDTRGVDFGPYLTQLVKTVREHWYGVIPESARPPLSKKGVVSVGFRIMKDGKVADLHYVEGSGDADLDQSVHDGIAASDPFPPLPKEFVCEYVALQLHFYYNPDMHPKQAPVKQVPADRQPLPCVTTTVRTIGEVAVRVLPNSANVATEVQQ
jgi:TonB family protein